MDAHVPVTAATAIKINESLLRNFEPAISHIRVVRRTSAGLTCWYLIRLDHIGVIAWKDLTAVILHAIVLSAAQSLVAEWN